MRLRNMLEICLVFCKSEPRYAYKRYAYKKKHVSDIFDGFMTSSMSDFFVILQFLATGSVIKCVETLDFHIEYVFR